MVALPILIKLTLNFLTKTNSDIQQDFALCTYLFLCSIFVAMTNQVSGLDDTYRLIFLSNLPYFEEKVQFNIKSLITWG